MATRADNAQIPRAGERVTLAELVDWRPVLVMVVQGGRAEQVEGTARAWTANSVYVAWKDEQGLQHLDWFDVADLRPA